MPAVKDQYEVKFEKQIINAAGIRSQVVRPEISNLTE
jgi:hypothetical protein